MNEKQKKNTSVFLALVLRHKPEEAGITLDAHGWADVRALLDGMTAAGCPINMDELAEIVRTDAKQRYAFSEDHTKIRANQGHSVAVEIEMTETAPPPVLWHGTATRFLESILREGLKPMSRQYVHLSKDRGTAVTVGARHGKPVVLEIDTQRMTADGYKFYLSPNGVWQTAQVPPQYLRLAAE